MSTAHDEIRAGLTSQGGTEKQLEEMTCPVCGSSLTLSVHSDMRTFFIRCASDTTHVGMHGQNDAAPEWWKAHITRGWY